MKEELIRTEMLLAAQLWTALPMPMWPYSALAAWAAM